MYKDRQTFDNVAWDKNDVDEDQSQMRLRRKDTCRQVESLVKQKCGKPATLVSPLVIGGLNIHYRIHLDGEESSSDVMVRLPWPYAACFPSEKVVYEAATAEYLRLNTRIPAAQVLYYGRDSNVGPFLILRRIEHRGDMTDALAVPGLDPNMTPVLNLELPESKLRSLWGNIASCLLEVVKPTFTRIGSLVEVDGSFRIAARPLTQNMSSMTQLAHIPPSILPLESETYATADEWYGALANMHLAQLIFQHNDLVSSEDDCRNKYVARQIFRRLAKQGRLSTFGFVEDDWSACVKTMHPRCPAPDKSGPFRLWCDDFRPANVLLGPDDDVAAVIDWEFTYAAPTQFMLDPPWWLLFETPEMWPSGIEEWSRAYEPLLKIWLETMEEKEQGAEFLHAQPLSVHMQESWKMGRFWLNYAARKSWAFDAVFWTYLDERFFGERDREVLDKDLWKIRLHLLSEEERWAMEPFVQQKMDESQERTLVEWDPAEAKQRLSELLFD
ncbi:hypothetical protein LHYA1_G007922 [Lachnellula hyalina]|uniref:Aminoglycoside phosphotransferase domain-containing protein n=1 Tax=Lachnellula hyalina TaxID=1316788 RepID=A0A8H8QYX6_9HELO|nr:uncharacterized protein LHYA1_G007922 [Lachnellula hyalina]TVY24315.1 hypothetical protein LHYA1_G007922 [Lachnellula hyalina]